MGKGCKVLMIVGVVLAAILVVGAVLSFYYCSEIMTSVMKKSVDTLETEVLTNLPEGFTIEDIKARFAEFKDVVVKQASEGKFSPQVQEWSMDVQKALQDKKISKDELEKLLEKMKNIVAAQIPSGS